MKKIFILILLSIPFFCVDVNAQSKYGNVTMEEMNMTSYPQDSAAGAVILLKIGETSFKYSDLYGFQFEHTIQMKIKILKDEGLRWCDKYIPYRELSNQRKETIESLSGTTYNLEDGKIVKTKLSKDFIFDEDTDERYRVKKFTMPGAKVGSVIEYKYKIVSNLFYNLQDFEFQSSIPTLYTSFESVIPEYFDYNVNTQGYEPLETKREPVNESFTIRHSGGIETVRCTAEKLLLKGKNIPAMKQENLLWTVEDYISKISFELRSVKMPYSMVENMSSTWQNIDKELLSGSFGGNLKKADLFKEEIKKGEPTLERAKEIQNMLKYKVKWNDKNAFGPGNLKEVLKTGIGNSGDMNFLLINALQAGGFDAFPVLLSTRANGRLPMAHPSIAAFNYTITGIKIDTVMYFTDASSKYGDWNLLPEKVMVPQARMLIPNRSDWVDLTTISNGTILKVGKFEFKDSKYEGKVTATRKGNAAMDFKQFYFGHKDKDTYIEELANSLTAEIDSFNLVGADDTNLPVKVDFIQKTDVALGDEFLYVNPLFEKFYTENPFKKETRVLPINFDYLNSYIQIVDIKIPEGYVAEELPKPAKMILNDNDIIVNYRISQVDNTIKVHFQYQLRKLIFLPAEYESLKDFFAKMISKSSEQIVLKKV